MVTQGFLASSTPLREHAWSVLTANLDVTTCDLKMIGVIIVIDVLIVFGAALVDHCTLIPSSSILAFTQTSHSATGCPVR